MGEEINVLYIVSEFPVIRSFYIYKCQPVIQKSQNGVPHSRFFAYSKAENCLKKRRYLQPPTQISSSAHADIFKSSWRYLPHRLHVNKPLIALIWRIEGLEKFVVPPVFASIDAHFFRTAIIGNYPAIIRLLLISQVLIKLRSVCSQNSPLADITLVRLVI